jgi:hypothetical protein
MRSTYPVGKKRSSFMLHKWLRLLFRHCSRMARNEPLRA